MANKAIFMDRDQSLIEDTGYINNPDQVKLLDGVAEALIQLRRMGYELIVISNQSAVARGIVTEQVLEKIHNRLRELLAEKGAYVDEIYYCPYHPEAIVSKYRRNSDLRKPNPGMLLKAAKQRDIQLNRSWMIGDQYHDIEAGIRAGCKTILLDNPERHGKTEFSDIQPDFKAVNMKEAANIIRKEKDSQQISEQINSEPVGSNTESYKTDKIEHLLGDILAGIKTIQRNNMFAEFSIMRLLAGILQVITMFCLLASVWFLMSPADKTGPVFIALGFAMVLQLMSLTFYLMQGRK